MTISDKAFFEELEREVESTENIERIFNSLNAELIIQQIEYYKAQTELAKVRTELINNQLRKSKEIYIS